MLNMLHYLIFRKRLHLIHTVLLTTTLYGTQCSCLAAGPVPVNYYIITIPGHQQTGYYRLQYEDASL